VREVKAFPAALLTCAFVMVAHAPAVADEACTNPNALGVSRTLVVDPTEHPLIGTMQYRETLPLADHEVVITFDDGPLPPNTGRILDILAAQCVKANYFMVGRMAKTFPKWVERVAAAGHTIGTHSQNHPLTFNRMPLERAESEINDGIAAVKAALGHDPAPFFRIPGLLRVKRVEDYLISQHIQTWSADFPADDWKRISDKEILKRALNRLEIHHKGILLLHDIHPGTALMLPTLLRELKARGYHIVHVVPAGPGLPKTATSPEQWLGHPPKHEEPIVAAAPPGTAGGAVPPAATATLQPAAVTPSAPNGKPVVLPTPAPASLPVSTPAKPAHHALLSRPAVSEARPRPMLPPPPMQLAPEAQAPVQVQALQAPPQQDILPPAPSLWASLLSKIRLPFQQQ